MKIRSKKRIKGLNKFKAAISWALVFSLFLFPVFPAFSQESPPSLPALPSAPAYNSSLPSAPQPPTSPYSSPDSSVNPDQSGGSSGGTSGGTQNGTSGTIEDPVVSIPRPSPMGDPVLSESNPSLQSSNSSSLTDPSNQNTGANSENSAELNSENSTDIKNKNDAKAQNYIRATANSGGNEANYNTGNGSITTGDSDVVLNLLNLINTVFVALPGGGILFIFENIYKDLIGNYIIDPVSGEAYTLSGSRMVVKNENTGYNSTNSSILNTNNETNIENSNKGNLNNNFELSSTTGGNQASYNTGNGSIETGDANASLNLLNFLNSSLTASTLGVFGILNIFGSWTGNLLIPLGLLGDPSNSALYLVVSNQNTGANSQNDASLNAENSLDINNDNKADVVNNVKIISNTGDNQTSYNTGNGDITTGSSESMLNAKTIANQNIVGDTIFIILVNVLGSWTGINLLPLALNNLNQSSSSANTTEVGNSNTGANSTNTAEANLENSLNIDNQNNGVLNNNFSINTSSGNNNASYNTGNGAIKTGDTNAIANILNFLNLNIVSSKFVFLLVNVFGSWLGNIDVLRPESNTAPSPSSSTQTNNTQAQKIAVFGQVFKVIPKKLGSTASYPQSENSSENGKVSGISTASSNFGNGALSFGAVNSAKPNSDKNLLNTFISLFKNYGKYFALTLLVLYLVWLNRYINKREEEIILHTRPLRNK